MTLCKLTEIDKLGKLGRRLMQKFSMSKKRSKSEKFDIKLLQHEIISFQKPNWLQQKFRRITILSRGAEVDLLFHFYEIIITN